MKDVLTLQVIYTRDLHVHVTRFLGTLSLYLQLYRDIAMTSSVEMKVSPQHACNALATRDCQDTLIATRDCQDTLIATRDCQDSLIATRDCQDSLIATRDCQDTLITTRDCQDTLIATRDCQDSLSCTCP